MKRILLAASLIASLTGFSQTISNKLSFKKGQKLEVVTETKKTSTMEMMGQSMETKVTSTVTESFDIENTDAGTTNIEYKVKRFVAEIDGMQGQQNFDSEKEGDRKGELGKLLEKSLKNKYTMTVDAYGKITTVKADDNNPNSKADAQQEAMIAMITEMVGFNTAVPKEGAASMFKFLPAKEITKGETWADSSVSDGQKKKTFYTVRSITDMDVVLDFTEEIEIDANRQMMGIDTKVKTITKSSGLIMLDRNTGLLKQKNYTREKPCKGNLGCSLKFMLESDISKQTLNLKLQDFYQFIARVLLVDE